MVQLKTYNSRDMQVFEQEVTMTSVSRVLIVTILVGAAYGNSTSSAVIKTVEQDVTFTCGIQNISTYPTWTKANLMNHEEDSFNTAVSSKPRSLSMSTRIRIDDNSLLLMNLALNDSGYYTCSVLGQGNHTITLTVIQPAESWKQAVVGLGVIILSLLPGVLCIKQIVRCNIDFRHNDKSGKRTACWICACFGWSFLLFISSFVAIGVNCTLSDELFPWYIVFLCGLDLLTVSTQIVIMIVYETQGNRQHIQTVDDEAMEKLGGENQS